MALVLDRTKGVVCHTPSVSRRQGATLSQRSA